MVFPRQRQAVQVADNGTCHSRAASRIRFLGASCRVGQSSSPLTRIRRLPAEQEAEIQRLAPGRTLRDLAVRFGISHETVRKTLRNGWEGKSPKLSVTPATVQQPLIISVVKNALSRLRDIKLFQVALATTMGLRFNPTTRPRSSLGHFQQAKPLHDLDEGHVANSSVRPIGTAALVEASIGQVPEAIVEAHPLGPVVRFEFSSLKITCYTTSTPIPSSRMALRCSSAVPVSVTTLLIRCIGITRNVRTRSNFE